MLTALTLHGLISVSNADQSSGIQWNNGALLAIATDTAWGSGLANTNVIVAAQGAGSYAASICKNYAGGGFHDWYLPSLGELNYLIDFLPEANYPTYAQYWARRRAIYLNAWIVYNNTLVNHFRDFFSTYETFRVRAIRTF